ncbi:hypothetical protein GE09DRAFT_683530 [Coniochaeta sp. 2T2.1]|nr:hypothetical protein GE09DRAFT_683530 [Coniochaeta sp. 2T2.1]
MPTRQEALLLAITDRAPVVLLSSVLPITWTDLIRDYVPLAFRRMAAGRTDFEQYCNNIRRFFREPLGGQRVDRAVIIILYIAAVRASGFGKVVMIFLLKHWSLVLFDCRASKADLLVCMEMPHDCWLGERR